MTISFLSHEGHRLAVEVRGEGPLVICSPAMGDSRDAFTPLAEYLSTRGFRVAQLDLRGHGDSEATFPRYGDEATAADLLVTIDQLGDGPAYLVGASMSAAAVVIAAGMRPGTVAGMVLLAPFLRGGGILNEIIFSLALARPWGPSVWRAFSARLWPGLGTEAANRAAYLTRLLTRPGRWRAFVRTTHTDHRVVEPWLNRVSVPSLIVMGSADPDWKSPSDEAQWAADRLGSAILFVPGAGHAPMLEAPELVSPIIAEFLQGSDHATRRS